MYRRCLFCAGDLGRNEALEAFPVGRRLAYDAARGRLWVVCVRCARWNLTPLEERWEAIEQAERAYRASPRRVATSNVGLARTPDGADLVRVGSARLPEFAAWRYGRQLASRRLRSLGVGAAALAFSGTALAGSLALPYVVPALAPAGGGVIGGVAVMFAFRALYDRAVSAAARGLDGVLGTDSDRVVAWLPPEPGRERAPVTYRHLAATRLGRDRDGSLRVSVAHRCGRSEYAGAAAQAVLSTLMPHVNHGGASTAEVEAAVRAIETRDGPVPYLRTVARSVERSRVTSRSSNATEGVGFSGASVAQTGLLALHDTQRLALEIALREEVERRAMEGELAELERAWREAEAVAAIADALVVPTAVERAFARLKGGARGG